MVCVSIIVLICSVSTFDSLYFFIILCIPEYLNDLLCDTAQEFELFFKQLSKTNAYIIIHNLCCHYLGLCQEMFAKHALYKRSTKLNPLEWRKMFLSAKSKFLLKISFTQILVPFYHNL